MRKGDTLRSEQRGSIKTEFGDSDQQPLRALMDELMPQIETDQAQRLLRILRSAQHAPPADKKLFVDRVNRLLDLYRIRIDTGDGELYRLKYLPGHSKRGFVYLLNGHGRNFNTFSVSTLSLVNAAACYQGNKFIPQPSHSLPVVAAP